MTAVVRLLGQRVWSIGSDTEGVGRTVIVKVRAVPTQPFAVGVTVMVATMLLEVVFTAVKAAILPVPVVAKPMLDVLFVQLKVVPVTVEVKATAAVIAPLQRT